MKILEIVKKADDKASKIVCDPIKKTIEIILETDAPNLDINEGNALKAWINDFQSIHSEPLTLVFLNTIPALNQSVPNSWWPEMSEHNSRGFGDKHLGEAISIIERFSLVIMRHENGEYPEMRGDIVNGIVQIKGTCISCFSFTPWQDFHPLMAWIYTFFISTNKYLEVHIHIEGFMDSAWKLLTQFMEIANVKFYWYNDEEEVGLEVKAFMGKKADIELRIIRY
jgi:hypothetical protein